MDRIGMMHKKEYNLVNPILRVKCLKRLESILELSGIEEFTRMCKWYLITFHITGMNNDAVQFINIESVRQNPLSHKEPVEIGVDSIISGYIYTNNTTPIMNNTVPTKLYCKQNITLQEQEHHAIMKLIKHNSFKSMFHCKKFFTMIEYLYHEIFDE